MLTSPKNRTGGCPGRGFGAYLFGRQDVMAITVYIVIIVDAGALDALLPTKKEHLLGGAGH